MEKEGADYWLVYPGERVKASVEMTGEFLG
jgi:hypothetical protein